MSYKSFKKISSDKNSTTMLHPDGHELKIAHALLKPHLRKQLADIPIHKQEEESPKMYAYGSSSGEVGSDDNQKQAPVIVNVGTPSNAGPGAALPDWATKSGASQIKDSFNQQTDTPSISKERAEQALANPNDPINKDYPDEVQKAAASYGLLKSPQANNAPAPASVPDTMSPPEATPQSAPTLAPTVNKPIPHATPMAAPIPPPAMPMQQEAAPQETTYQKSYNDYKQEHQQQFAQEDAAFEHDLTNGHIEPKTYHDLFAKKSTLGKIGTIFGLMMSGAGSGISHQPNALLAAMNQEIKNDLDSQMQSKTNAQNFIKINQQQQMQNAQIGLTEAQKKSMLADAGIKSFTMANLMANRAALHNQTLMVQKMAEGPDKEQAKQALGMMSTAVNAENANLADVGAARLALLQSTQTGGNTIGMRMVPGMENMANAIDQRSIPGVGMGSIPVSQETRDRLLALKQYDQKAKEYVEFAKKHAANWANLNPVERKQIANQGASMGANLQSIYRNKIKGGVYKKGEQEFISQVIPDQPASWSASFNAIPKVEQTIRDNENDLKSVAGSVGINYAPSESSDMVTVVSPSGQRGSIPKANLQKALNQKYRLAP